MHNLNVLQQIAVWAIPILFAVTLHEVAHGWVARLLGDRTAQMLGRLSLNPLKHIDPMGTVVIPLVLALSSVGVIFGWAKPVPITMQNLRHPKRDMAFVAVAGPLSNLLMAFIWVIILKLALLFGDQASATVIFISYVCFAGITINLLLLVINLIPIPPLDGSRVVSALLPGPLEWKYNQLEGYGLFIFFGLMLLLNYTGHIIYLIQFLDWLKLLLLNLVF
ncbi:MAG: site-2 protease family protein [Gammaproteobacteria bacterium]|nr:MAG: site-2 protease family protein [Gammaproteobacteria bacterium]